MTRLPGVFMRGGAFPVLELSVAWAPASFEETMGPNDESDGEAVATPSGGVDPIDVTFAWQVQPDASIDFEEVGGVFDPATVRFTTDATADDVYNGTLRATATDGDMNTAHADLPVQITVETPPTGPIDVTLGAMDFGENLFVCGYSDGNFGSTDPSTPLVNGSELTEVTHNAMNGDASRFWSIVIDGEHPQGFWTQVDIAFDGGTLTFLSANADEFNPSPSQTRWNFDGDPAPGGDADWTPDEEAQVRTVTFSTEEAP